MARSTPQPVKSKTLKVQSGVNAGGLTPGKIAEVEDTEQVRGLISAGLWTLLVTEEELQVAVGPEVVVGDTLDALVGAPTEV